MRILVIIKWMVRWNGASKVAYELSKRFSSSGHDVRIVAYGDHIDPDWGKEFTFYRLKSKGLFAISKLRSIVREYDPDIIHSHDWLGLFVVGQGIPLISTNHSNWPVNWFFGLDTFFAGIIQGIPNEIKLYFSDKVVSVSNYQQKQLLKHGINSDVIYNGVDDGFFEPPNEKMERNRPTVLFVGTVDNRKAKYLVSYVEELNRIEPVVQYNVIGAPVDNNIVKALRNINNVHYLGIVDEVKPYYYQADVLVFVSRAEMCPLVLLEALACGLPIVAFDVCSNEEIIQNENCGYIVSPKDVHSLARKTLDIIKDKKLKEEFGQNGSKRASQYFSWKERTKDYLALFSKFCS